MACIEWCLTEQTLANGLRGASEPHELHVGAHRIGRGRRDPLSATRRLDDQMTSLAESLSGSKAGAPIPDQVYRCPQDLAVTPLMLRRVLVVGSCLRVEAEDMTLPRLFTRTAIITHHDRALLKIQYMPTAKRVTIASPTLIAFRLG